MPNLGPTELLIILALPVVIVTLIVAKVVTSARRAPHRRNGPRPHLDASQLHRQATALVTAGNAIAAIKLVREQTGLDLTNAKRYVDDLRAGRTPQPPPSHHGATAAHPPTPLSPPGYYGTDLATRVRLLKTTGRSGQAVLLVRGETGMSEPDAQRFVDAIQA
ncbi:hypothetical protein AB0J63_20185 [Streptosporangium canum]|uniref:hypothetical protein n=1 Tax=Streptosporangium canum TaxID=324952 RepID=UPI0034291FE2